LEGRPKKIGVALASGFVSAVILSVAGLGGTARPEEQFRTRNLA
jgi:hypothetical protein